MARVVRAFPAAHRYYHTATSSFSSNDLYNSLPTVNTIIADHHLLNGDLFREQAFEPEQPALITTSNKAWRDLPSSTEMPALKKWFKTWYDATGTDKCNCRYSLKTEYLRRFGDCIVPYELVTTSYMEKNTDHPLAKIYRHLSWYQRAVKTGTWSNLKPIVTLAKKQTISRQHPEALESGNVTHATNFHSFDAPLELFVRAAQRKKVTKWMGDIPPTERYAFHIPNLYIAQAQISKLPEALQADLPTPRLVREAGKGDIYDANLWMGTPPTYTPLHKDPNPNFFVQLASYKRVRLFRAEVGLLIFQQVREKLGKPASAVFRGEEMMIDPERGMLEDTVWKSLPDIDGYEAIVRPGDALFIPKGWWHSVKSLGTDVNASVNWWFR